MILFGGRDSCSRFVIIRSSAVETDIYSATREWQLLAKDSACRTLWENFFLRLCIRNRKNWKIEMYSSSAHFQDAIFRKQRLPRCSRLKSNAKRARSLKYIGEMTFLSFINNVSIIVYRQQSKYSKRWYKRCRQKTYRCPFPHSSHTWTIFVRFGFFFLIFA